MTCIGASTKDGQAEQGLQGGHRSSTDADSLLDYGPETDLACAEHEFGLVIVQCEVSQADDGCAARTSDTVSFMGLGGLKKTSQVCKEHSQGSEAKHQSHRDLDSPSHLEGDQQDGGQDRQGQVGDDGHGREEEADAAVEDGIAFAGRLAPQGRDGVTDVGDDEDEHDRGNGGCANDEPDGPHEPTASIGDAEEGYTDAGLYRHGT